MRALLMTKKQQGWQPGANTLLYMPLNGDVLDYSGNNNNGTWSGTSEYRTVGSKKYAYFNQNSAISLTNYPVGTGNPDDFTFACRAFITASIGVVHCFYMGTDTNGKRFDLILNYRMSSSSYYHIMDFYVNNGYLSSNMNSPQCPGERVYVVYTYKKSGSVSTLYINNTQTGSSTSYSLNIGNTFKYIGRQMSDSAYAGYGLADIVFESGIWTEDERKKYYNLNCKYYGKPQIL